MYILIFYLRFPLENQSRVKNWLNNMGCLNWQPLESDRICSDHFEKVDISMKKNGYKLHNNAIPLINPKVYTILSLICNYI